MARDCGTLSLRLIRRPSAPYANRARRGGRDYSTMQIRNEGSGLRFLLFAVAFRFELRELLLRQDALGFFHVLRLACFRAPGFLMLGHHRFHLRFLIRSQIETGQRHRTGGFCFVPNFLGAIAVFTREHCSRCEYTRHH